MTAPDLKGIIDTADHFGYTQKVADQRSARHYDKRGKPNEVSLLWSG